MTTVTTVVASNGARFMQVAKTVGAMMATGAVIGTGVGAGILATGAVIAGAGLVVAGAGFAADTISKKIEQRKLNKEKTVSAA